MIELFCFVVFIVLCICYDLILLVVLVNLVLELLDEFGDVEMKV